MALIGYNERILDLTVGGPGSTHDPRLLRNTGLYKKIICGSGLPNKTVDLDTSDGEITLVSTGESIFPRFPWLIEGFSRDTDKLKERSCNLKPSSARVVNENVNGMLRRCWRMLCKKTEMKIFDLKYIIMACAKLHNFCIVRNDP